MENAYYILTPTQESPVTAIQGLQTLISSIGAIPLIMDYHTHDYVTAAVSHLPHIISAGLVNLVHDSDSAEGVMKMIAAGGFKDITRISSSSPVMWQSICMTNTENILTLLTSYIESLQKVKAELQNKDAQKLYDLFDDAKNYRDSFSNEGRGPIKKPMSFLWISLMYPVLSHRPPRFLPITISASKTSVSCTPESFSRGHLKLNFTMNRQQTMLSVY